MSNPFASLIRPVQSDNLFAELIAAYVKIENALLVEKGYNITAGSRTARAEPTLGYPQPQEPYPALYNGLAGASMDYTQGEPVRRNLIRIETRFLVGPATMNYKYQVETKTYQLINAFVNELDWRPFLQDPDTGDKFPYCDPSKPCQVQSVSRTTAFHYSDLGLFVGVSVVSEIGTLVQMGRLP